MNIYEKGTTNFSSNGVGFLTDIISSTIIDEINGTYILNLEYPLNGHLSEYLVEGNIIKSKVADGTYQPFIISSTAKNFKTIKVTANHIFYLLLDNFLEDVYPQNLSAPTFLNWILARTQYPNLFTGFSDITDIKSARYVRKNPVESIIGADNSMINLFGGELKRDNFNIHLMSRLGSDNDVKLEIGKNITGITISTDFSNTFTRIMPVGFDELILPEKYIDSSLIDIYPYPKIGVISFDDIKYDPEDENAYQDIDDAYREMRERVRKLYQEGIDKPKINIKVDWIELSKTNEYKNYSNLERVNLGDTVHSHVLGTDFETRVIKTTYNPLLDRIEKFEIGSAIATIGTSMNSFYKQVEQIKPTSILKAAKDNATSLITQAMGGYIYKTQSELYIMDTNDPTTATKVWRWNINGLGYSSTGINGPYGLAMTMDGAIVADFITTGKLNTNVIEGYNSLELQVQENKDNNASLKLRVDGIEQSISDIADITVTQEGIGRLEFTGIPESEPISVKIYPTNEDISFLYPLNNLYPDDNLYMPSRDLIFKNIDTSEVVRYELPDDLYWYDENTYDEFELDYENRICKIIKRVACDDNDNKTILATPVVKDDYEYPTIELDGGRYEVYMEDFSGAHLMVRLMTNNVYTTQFPTKAELNSKILQTVDKIESDVNAKFTTKEETRELDSRFTQTMSEIKLEVSETYATKDDLNVAKAEFRVTTDGISSEVSKKVGNNEIISKINQSAESITINANKISLYGKTIALTSDNIKISSTNFSVNSAGKITATNATISGSITASSGKIGGALINSLGLYFNNGNTGWGLWGTTSHGNVVIHAGANTSNIGSAPFRVLHDGTLYASKGSISGSIVTSGIDASNVTAGAISACDINIYNGTGFIKMLSGSAYHPFVSALNVARGSGGIVFRSSGDRGNTGSNIGQIYADNNVIYISASNGTNVANYLKTPTVEATTAIKTGNLYLSGTEIDGAGDTYIRLNTSVVLKPNPNGGAYIWGTEDYNKIRTQGGTPSTLSVKERVTKKDISDIPEILREIELFDYKYIKEIEQGKEDYGYIIDYLEKIPHIKKYFKFYDSERNNIKFKQIDENQFEKFLLGAVVILQKQIDKLERNL